jgi:hypothetical protein
MVTYHNINIQLPLLAPFDSLYWNFIAEITKSDVHESNFIQLTLHLIQFIKTTCLDCCELVGLLRTGRPRLRFTVSTSKPILILILGFLRSFRNICYPFTCSSRVEHFATLVTDSLKIGGGGKKHLVVRTIVTKYHTAVMTVMLKISLDTFTSYSKHVIL